jgi:hypothetical protein
MTATDGWMSLNAEAHLQGRQISRGSAAAATLTALGRCSAQFGSLLGRLDHTSERRDRVSRGEQEYLGKRRPG